MKESIIPSIIATSQQELDTRLAKIREVKPKLIQLDVMDGLFVPHTSFEFDFKLSTGRYEAHLMMNNPEPWLSRHSSNMSSVIFHYESKIHLHQVIKSAKILSKKVGIAINPETPIEGIVQYLKHIDKVLIMTVYPGKYGSPFVPSMLEKIRELRKLAPKIDIQVDGGINPSTIEKCKGAGANQFVVGSFLQNASDVKTAWKELKV
jgi:ribulose-phosphate 3-epimerase